MSGLEPGLPALPSVLILPSEPSKLGLDPDSFYSTKTITNQIHLWSLIGSSSLFDV